MAIDGDLVYAYKTLNMNAAISVAIPAAREVTSYGLDGTGQIVGIWDGGEVRAGHQEFDTRVNVIDGGEQMNHSTHVAGTIGAAGMVENATGMAPNVMIDSYNWEDDISEMTAAAMSYAGEPNKIQISNHSYGTVAGWDYIEETPRWYGRWGRRESDVFGRYDNAARDIDKLCYDAPYYLPVLPSGNDRTEHAPDEGETFEYYTVRFGWRQKPYDSAIDPYDDGWDNGGYDTMLPTSTAKNGMAVGSVRDAVKYGSRDLERATIANSSGWGPADDGRIKPDIVANGVSIYSPIADSDTSYATYSGSSMATACASGAAVLLAEHWTKLFPGSAIRSSTLKGVIIHTADDLGTPGPDYAYGWGLMNIKAATDHLAGYFDYPHAGAVMEDTLDGEVVVQESRFFWDGNSPIRATLSWTDPAAPALEGLDNSSPRLVNDLDLRIIDPCDIVHYPFILNPTQPAQQATTGDNTRDNIEQVLIPSPEAHGVYTVRVEYKGALVNASQHYSLLLSGQSIDHIPSADLDESGRIDLYDLTMLLDYWLTDEASVDLAPIGGDGIIDMADFAELLWQLKQAN